MSKWVYDFGFGNADGNASMRDILGGKGANLEIGRASCRERV